MPYLGFRSTFMMGAILLSSAAFGAPQIQSVQFADENAEVLIVKGVGFGVHPDFSPNQTGFLAAGWHDFESGQLQGGNVFRDSISPGQWSVEFETPRHGSSRYAKKVYIDDERGELYVLQSGTTGVWYGSFWMRLQTPEEQQSGKFFRVYGGSSNIYLSIGGGGFSIRGYSECSQCTPPPNTVWGSPQSFKANTWHRVEVEMTENPDVFAVYMDGVLQWRRSSLLAGSEREQWVPNPFRGNGHTFGIGEMLDDPARGWPATGSYKFDDFYVSYTRARVEVSAAPIWPEAKSRELQIPYEWSDSEIRLHFRRGGLQDVPLYLYVVDSNGLVNPVGIPIAPVGKALPKPPTQVEILGGRN
jgi:hypothetical protein